MNAYNCVAPEADIPDCNLDGAESGINVRFLVLNHNNEQPIASVLWEVQRNKRKAYSGLGGSDGRFAFSPVPRAYTYSLDRAGYFPLEGIPMVISGIGVPHTWDECLPPVIMQVGEYDFVARMKPLLLEKQCLATGQTFIFTDEDTVVPNQRHITLTNNSGEPVTLFALSPVSPSVTITGPSRPVTVAPNETIEFLITGTGDLTGEVLAADMDCTDSPVDIVIGDETLSVQLTFWTYPGPVEETETIEMTGTLASGVYVGTCSKGDLTFQWNISPEGWSITFDDPVATTGGAITPFHNELVGSPYGGTGGDDRNNTDGYYLDMDAAPFPNWVANIPVPP